MSCIDSIDIYSIDGMVEKPSVSAFQNFLWIEYRLNIKKVMDKNAWMCFCINSVNIYSIECIRDPCPVLTSIDIYSIDGMVEKPSVAAFQNIFAD